MLIKFFMSLTLLIFAVGVVGCQNQRTAHVLDVLVVNSKNKRAMASLPLTLGQNVDYELAMNGHQYQLRGNIKINDNGCYQGTFAIGIHDKNGARSRRESLVAMKGNRWRPLNPSFVISLETIGSEIDSAWYIRIRCDELIYLTIPDDAMQLPYGFDPEQDVMTGFKE